MILRFLFFSTFCSIFSFGQELNEFDSIPYNKEFNFKLIDEGMIVENDESLECLIIVFHQLNFKNAELSIANNPKLKEIKIFGSNQEFINLVSQLKLDSLTHLFIQNFKEKTLYIPKFSTLEHLSIQSSELIELNMTQSEMVKLYILDIETPKLKEWKSEKSFFNLSLIHLKAELLVYFPIENMPNISQFVYYCSFVDLPFNLCSYKDLKFMSFDNYHPIQIDKCMIKKIKNGVYSNLTIYENIGGKVISEINSKDKLK